LEAQRAGVKARIVECTCRSSGVYLSGGVCVYMAPDTHQCSNWFVFFCTKLAVFEAAVHRLNISIMSHVFIEIAFVVSDHAHAGQRECGYAMTRVGWLSSRHPLILNT
jgi:hypothetical protein